MKEELENRWRDLGEFIREQRRIGHLSLRKLSEMAGISNPYLSQIERGLRKPSAEILQQIARALEISSETLYIRAGILEEREGQDEVIPAIRRDPVLTEDQKKTLVQIYESFRRESDVLRVRPTRPPGVSDEESRLGTGG
jgi:transcriptional regulator with XRE-family HTH domain